MIEAGEFQHKKTESLEAAPAMRLGDKLLEAAVITQHQLNSALIEQKRSGQLLGQILLQLGFVTEEELNQALGGQYGVPHITLNSVMVDPIAVATVPEALTRKHRFVPISLREGVLTVAMANPEDVHTCDLLENHLDVTLEILWATEADIYQTIERYYQQKEGINREFQDTIDRAVAEGSEAGGTEFTFEDAPIIELVNQIINQAITEKATDIHIGPEEGFVRIRYRLDGLLTQANVIPRDLQAALISRIKIMANMDIAEKRLPQDGRIYLNVGTQSIFIRVSSIPTVYGENLVLRVLNKDSTHLNLESLGMVESDLIRFKGALEASSGLALVTGPTGSGKTTSLYSALKLLSSVERNILTLEDPVEYELPLIRQAQINPKIGFTFASGLRTLLRQDPDIILVGEIRDIETVEICLRAAMTGHLVLSTIHTNSAIETVPRLIDMGVDLFLFSSALKLIQAQRLVRRICPDCRAERPATDIELRGLGYGADEKIMVWEGEGCPACKGSGYKGRIGIFEVCVPDVAFGKAIIDNKSVEDMQEIARKGGMTTLWEDAKAKILKGESTIQEVMRVL